MSDPIIIIGGGHAAATFVEKYRKFSGSRSLLIVSDEPVAPYHRPPLSKKYLLGEQDLEDLFIYPPERYQELQTQIRLNTRVTAINPADHTVTLDNSEILGYHKLIIATGSRPRLLPDELLTEVSDSVAGVLTLNDINDVKRMKPYFSSGKKLLIIGGGYIGLETAAVASALEMDVTVVELSERILQRVAAGQTSDYFRQLHQDHGVRILESTAVSRLQVENGQVYQAVLSSGDMIDVDAVLVGIGGLANSELAEAAGLPVANGIVVDEYCQVESKNQAEADIYAVGDCANVPYDEDRVRFESVQNANAMAALVAQNLAGEEAEQCVPAKAFQPKPWFWSDQYDVKLQIEGFNKGYDQAILRQGAKPNSQSVWYFKDNKFIAVDAMSDPVSFVLGKKWLATGHSPDAEKISDSSLDLKTI